MGQFLHRLVRLGHHLVRAFMRLSACVAFFSFCLAMEDISSRDEESNEYDDQHVPRDYASMNKAARIVVDEVRVG